MQFGNATPYWPCSPHNPEGWRHGINNERSGDAHFWDVWHARMPVKRYEEKNFRFCSEFGMQSYSSPEVAATFCPPEEFNVFSPAMENHQKNTAGNQIILDYVSRLYRFPKDYAALAYLSQLNQAHCLKIGVEHFRRSMPRTMGALYWQLNDCWPVFSWSSLEFGGNWKALHYAAKRFFAPGLVSAHVLGDETAGIGNRVSSTIHAVDLYTVYDGQPAETRGHLGWELRRLDLRGGCVESGGGKFRCATGESVRHERLDFADAMAQHGAANLCLRVTLAIAGRIVSEDTVFLTAPRFLNLPRAPVQTRVLALDADARGAHAELEFLSPVFQHRVCFKLEGAGAAGVRASDNFFDLHSNQPRRVSVRLPDLGAVWDETEILARLRILSLADTY